MATTNEQDQTDEDIPLWAVELGCWTMVVLAPILTWVNGPAVSGDQFVVRTGVFCLALAGGIGLRVASVVRSRRARAAGEKERDVNTGALCEVSPPGTMDGERER